MAKRLTAAAGREDQGRHRAPEGARRRVPGPLPRGPAHRQEVVGCEAAPRGQPHQEDDRPWPAFGLAEARDLAEVDIRGTERGEDPRERTLTVEDAVADWLRRDQAGNRSAAEVGRVFEKKVLDASSKPCWRGRALASITRADCRELVEAVADGGAPTTARRLQAHLHRFFRWSVGVGIAATNPVADMPKVGREVARDRVLTDAELGLVWRAAGDMPYPFGPAFRLLVLTGCRRDEVVGLAGRR